MTHVTVLMAVLNAERYIGQAIQSVLDQTYQDWDLLVLDGGSTDRTWDLAQGFHDPRICVVARRGAGYAAGMQEGVEAARGPYVAILDADDLALPDRLGLQASLLDSRPEVVAVGGQGFSFSEGSGLQRLRRWRSDRLLRLALLNDNPFLHPAIMMRLDVVRSVGGYRPAFLFADYDLLVRMAAAGRIHNLPDPVLLYRRHGAGISQSRPTMASFSERLAIQQEARWALGPAWLGGLLIMKTRLRRFWAARRPAEGGGPP